jgi:hypothetical protein
MAKGKVYRSSYPENPPQWYWVDGLHDAYIECVECFEFPFDYNKFVGNKNSYDRNLLSLKINSSGAIYDQNVKEIRLFNFKIITKDIELQGRKKVWWLADRLTEEDVCYFLEIDLQDFDPYPEEFTFKIKFERAEVIRE